MKNLIILHGWGQAAKYWESFPEIEGVKIQAWDLPGFGDEPLLNSEWGIPEYANWVKEKVAAERLDNVILLGHSFGGRITSLIASENPSWLRGIILDGSPSIYRPTLEIKLKILMAKVMKKLGIKRKVIGNEGLKSAELRGLDKVFRKVVNFDQTALLPHIKVPTLLIWGEQDDIVPVRIAQEILKLIHQSQLEIFKNAGHHTFISNPSLFYGTVKKFIQNL